MLEKREVRRLHTVVVPGVTKQPQSSRTSHKDG